MKSQKVSFIHSFGWIALFGLALLSLKPESANAASSSWSSSNRPSWASTSGNESSYSAPKRKTFFDDDSNISPFSPGSNNVSLQIGQVFLMGDLSDRYSDNIGGRLNYTYGVSDMFGFDSSLGYSSHGDGAFSMTTALVGLRMNLTWYDKIIPHAVFGMGFYKPSYRLTNEIPATTMSPVLFGLHMGPGIDLELTKKIFFGASLRFHDIFGNIQTSARGTNVEVGGTFTTFFIHSGVTF